MGGPLWIVELAAGVASFLCSLYAIARMFRERDTTWAIASLVTIGFPLPALIRTYQRRNEWGLGAFVYVWIGLFAGSMLLSPVLLAEKPVSRPSR